MKAVWRIICNKQARKDATGVEARERRPKVEKLLENIRKIFPDLSQGYEKLSGNLNELYSGRIHAQTRLAYEILKNTHTIRIWTYY